tara:strand:+ start:192 stop:1139 length:948 start_codon:yes stop_codon:yes gene_type:complete
MNYSIIIPVFNEESSIENLHKELESALDQLVSSNRLVELIYVNDGSSDSTLKKLLTFKPEGFEIKIVNNFRNFSQSVSIYHGIELSKYDNLIFLDGDGQNDPANIVSMIKEYETGVDLVHGYRKKRKDNFLTKTLPSLIANYLVRVISKSKIRDHGCSLKIIHKKFLNKDKLWGDFHRLLAARLVNENIKIIQVETNHRYRKYGKSNYGFTRIFRVLIDLFYIYLFQKSYNNFYIIGYLGIFSFILSLSSFIYMLKLKFINHISFIDTPLPTVTVLFGISALLFFSFMFIIQTMLNLKNEIKSDQKNYEVIDLSK